MYDLERTYTHTLTRHHIHRFSHSHIHTHTHTHRHRTHTHIYVFIYGNCTVTQHTRRRRHTRRATGSMATLADLSVLQVTLGDAQRQRVPGRSSNAHLFYLN